VKTPPSNDVNHSWYVASDYASDITNEASFRPPRSQHNHSRWRFSTTEIKRDKRVCLNADIHRSAYYRQCEENVHSFLLWSDFFYKSTCHVNYVSVLKMFIVSQRLIFAIHAQPTTLYDLLPEGSARWIYHKPICHLQLLQAPVSSTR